MSRSCPEALQMLLEVVVGQRWPEADIAGLRDAAARWRSLGKAVTQQHAHADQAAGAMAENRGLGIEAFTAMWSRLSNTDVAELSRLCEGLASSLERFAGDTEACQDFIIIQLELLAAEVGFALVSGVFTFGIGELAAEAAVLATRAVIGTAIRELVEKAITTAAKLALRGGGHAQRRAAARPARRARRLLLQRRRAVHRRSVWHGRRRGDRTRYPPGQRRDQPHPRPLTHSRSRSPTSRAGRPALHNPRQQHRHRRGRDDRYPSGHGRGRRGYGRSACR